MAVASIVAVRDGSLNENRLYVDGSKGSASKAYFYRL
jgi:hypothetical protein